MYLAWREHSRYYWTTTPNVVLNAFKNLTIETYKDKTTWQGYELVQMEASIRLMPHGMRWLIPVRLPCAIPKNMSDSSNVTSVAICGLYTTGCGPFSGSRR